MTETNVPTIITVVLEYSHKLKRVIVRKAYTGSSRPTEPLEMGNDMNYVKVWDGVDMKYNVGFSNLIVEDEMEAK